MARLSFFLVAVFLLLSFVFAKEAYIRPAGGEGSLKPAECAGACDYRCSATSRRKACLFFCNMCCKKCLCVPSGTYGNKDECPCYKNWKNKKGGPKCP